MIYFATLGEVTYDPKTNMPVQSTLGQLIQKIIQFFGALIILGIYSSFLYHYDFELFDTGVEINSFDHTIRDMLSVGHLMNNFSGAGEHFYSYESEF